MTQQQLRECDQCAKMRADVEVRENGQDECMECWRSSLEHGHMHGIHDDGVEDPADPILDDCPLCPPMAERIRRRAERDARLSREDADADLRFLLNVGIEQPTYTDCQNCGTADHSIAGTFCPCACHTKENANG